MITDVDKLCPRLASSPSPFDIYSSLSLFLSLFLEETSYSKKLSSGLYSASPGLCQQDCFYFSRIIWSLDESISSSVTSWIYFEWMLKGALNTASQWKSKIHAGAWLTFTDTYFAALTVNITTYVFVFPTTDWVVVWHVEVKSARRCKYSSWAFMLSCQTSSQQQQTDLRAKGGLGVAPLRDCRIWLIISEWWSCHHNRSVSSLHTARAMRWNVRTRAQTSNGALSHSFRASFPGYLCHSELIIENLYISDITKIHWASYFIFGSACHLLKDWGSLFTARKQTRMIFLWFQRSIKLSGWVVPWSSPVSLYLETVNFPKKLSVVFAAPLSSVWQPACLRPDPFLLVKWFLL